MYFGGMWGSPCCLVLTVSSECMSMSPVVPPIPPASMDCMPQKISQARGHSDVHVTDINIRGSPFVFAMANGHFLYAAGCGLDELKSEMVAVCAASPSLTRPAPSSVSTVWAIKRRPEREGLRFTRIKRTECVAEVMGFASGADALQISYS